MRKILIFNLFAVLVIACGDGDAPDDSITADDPSWWVGNWRVAEYSTTSGALVQIDVSKQCNLTSFGDGNGDFNFGLTEAKLYGLKITKDSVTFTTEDKFFLCDNLQKNRVSYTSNQTTLQLLFDNRTWQITKLAKDEIWLTTDVLTIDDEIEYKLRH